MTPDAALDPINDPKNQPPSTAGMTTKVVKGSIWTLGGSILPLAVSFISTPFVIHFLGSEGYGVLLLVGLIPTYFSFADLGMGVAATKFASEAYGEGNAQKEREVVWTAGAVAATSASIVAIPIILFSHQIVVAMNVPEKFLNEAGLALKIAAASFVLGILATVLNAPMLARLRMDLNTATQAGPRVMLGVITPVVLFLGGGIVGAVAWSFVVSVVAITAVLYFSSRMLSGFFPPSFSYDRLRPILSFGSAWFVAMVASLVLVNLEKFFLTKMVSVQACSCIIRSRSHLRTLRFCFHGEWSSLLYRHFLNSPHLRNEGNLRRWYLEAFG